MKYVIQSEIAFSNRLSEVKYVFIDEGVTCCGPLRIAKVYDSKSEAEAVKNRLSALWIYHRDKLAVRPVVLKDGEGWELITEEAERHNLLLKGNKL